MYRFLLRPRWIVFTVVVVVAIVAMINLGFWQLRRLDERREFNDTVADRIDQPAVALDELVAADAEVGDDELQRRRVAAGRGVRSLPRRTRSCASSTAHKAAAPATTSSPRCCLDDGRVLLVARGFVPARQRMVPGTDAATSPSRAVCADRRCVAPARCPTPVRGS